jgi:hypothetical protein
LPQMATCARALQSATNSSQAPLRALFPPQTLYRSHPLLHCYKIKSLHAGFAGSSCLHRWHPSAMMTAMNTMCQPGMLVGRAQYQWLGASQACLLGARDCVGGMAVVQTQFSTLPEGAVCQKDSARGLQVCRCQVVQTWHTCTCEHTTAHVQQPNTIRNQLCLHLPSPPSFSTSLP